jgi:hypothetical protein
MATKPNPAVLVTQYIDSIPDWRGKLLAQLRTLIEKTDPTLQLGWKWSVPVWTSNGLVFAISAFKDHVKMNFFHGAALNDKHKLFNNGFDSKDHRSIDFSQTDTIDEGKLGILIQEAIDYNAKS